MTVLALIGLILSLAVQAQQEEVRVVKPYNPTLSGAEKIQLLPDLDGEIDYEPPTFTYQLFQKRYDSQFRVEPIQAARMVQMPLSRLYKTQLTMGMGNYLTPLFELNASQLRSRDGTFGVNLRHHSMNGKIKLDNELKTDAGFNENLAEVYGSRFLKNSVFEYRTGATYNANVHYGVDPELDTVISREDAVHPYFTAAAAVGMHSMHADSFHFNYDTDLEYYYFTHRFDRRDEGGKFEHGGKFDFRFDKKLRVVDIAGDAGSAYYYRYTDTDTASTVDHNTFFWLNPHIGKQSQEWKFTAGFKTYGHVENGVFRLHFYPQATFQFNIVKEVIVPYFGVDGYLEPNNTRSVTEENPYVIPGMGYRPTSHKLIAYAGLKGRFSRALAWNLKGSYSIIDDRYFFVNDTGTALMNQFNVVYDDITLVNLHGEFTFRPTDSWKLFLKGNYYSYTLVREDHPWNLPDFDLSLQARYNMRDKILVDMGIYTVGPRYYLDFNPALEETLPLTVDANLGIEYRYSRLLSFWIRFNNLAAQRYYLYHQYPSYRFRVMVGLTYAL